MFKNQIIKDHSHRQYVIIPSRQYDSKCGITPVEIWDRDYSRHFIRSLDVADNYWLDILSHIGLSITTDPNLAETAASQLLLNQHLYVLPVIPFPTNRADIAARTLQLDHQAP